MRVEGREEIQALKLLMRHVGFIKNFLLHIKFSYWKH